VRPGPAALLGWSHSSLLPEHPAAAPALPEKSESEGEMQRVTCDK
jgi:hypothetical protein